VFRGRHGASVLSEPGARSIICISSCPGIFRPSLPFPSLNGEPIPQPIPSLDYKTFNFSMPISSMHVYYLSFFAFKPCLFLASVRRLLALSSSSCDFFAEFSKGLEPDSRNEVCDCCLLLPICRYTCRPAGERQPPSPRLHRSFVASPLPQTKGVLHFSSEAKPSLSHRRLAPRFHSRGE